MPALGILAGCSAAKTELRVAVPVVDLRAESHTSASPAIHDPLQETQLLYGERVLVHQRRDGWAYVEALEQSEFSHGNRWEGYPGWVPESTLLHDDRRMPPNLIVRPWVEKGDYNGVRFDFNRRLKAVFDESGIKIP